jgi:flagellar basal-body rod modification protein FlgD
MSDSLTAATNAAAASYALSSNSGTTSAAAAAASAGAAATPNALAQLGANFNQFLQLLLTQVQNQDPTNPTDTTEFTTELVQFTGVQEQVDANTSLGQLIGLQQSSQVLQSTSLVGKAATVSANQITLQNGNGEIQFQGTAGQQVAIGIVDANGNPVYDTTLTAAAGNNTWQWNGVNNSGTQEPDGAYSIAVETAATNGTATPVTYSVVGTTTGVSTSGTTTQLQLGALSVGLSALQSVDQ